MPFIHGERSRSGSEIWVRCGIVSAMALNMRSISSRGQFLGLALVFHQRGQSQLDCRADVVAHDALECPLNHGGDGH